MTRVVLPERLDSLAPDDPLAIGSRRDLVKINAINRGVTVVAGALAPSRPRRVLEIGAGDGSFGLKVARAVRPDSMTLLDLQPQPSRAAEFDTLGIGYAAVAADAFDYLADDGIGRFDAVTANLFLHHFEDDRLAELLRLVALRTDLFVATEPRRSGAALAGTRMLWAIGCNAVTRHDARVSVLAGFAGDELSALWPAPGWRLAERASPPFEHLFIAERGLVVERGFGAERAA